jgi:hypothetical protein
LKIFRFVRDPNQLFNPAVYRDKRGDRDRHDRAVGCDGR